MASSWVGDMVKGNYLLYLFYWTGSSSMIMERGAGFHLRLEKSRQVRKIGHDDVSDQFLLHLKTQKKFTNNWPCFTSIG